MHIAIDARIISTTTGRYVERLVTYLQEIDRTNQYTILVREKDQHYWKPSAKNFAVRVAEFDDYSVAEQAGFNSLLNELGADLVHFCMPQQPILYRGKKVTTFHDLTLVKTYNRDKNWLVYHAKQAIGKWIFKKVARDSNHIIVPSLFTKKELIEYAGVADNKITLTYESSDVSTVAPRRYKLPFKRYILYVGNQSTYKNIARLGDAHQKLLEKYPDLGLVLVGKKNAGSDINERYFEKKRYNNILFTGFVSDAELSWLYAHADSYVFPSLMEGFGLPALEAMGHGTPVTSSNATCLPEIYGDAAHYFDPESVEDMVRAIDEVLSNESLRHQLSAAGYKQIKKYSWKKMAKETHAVYMRVLTNSSEQS